MHDQAKQTKNHGKKNSKCRFCTSVIAKKIALALPILKALLKNKPVINIPANLQAYFNNRRYFPILMPKFDHNAILFRCMYTFFHCINWVLLSLSGYILTAALDLFGSV